MFGYHPSSGRGPPDPRSSAPPIIERWMAPSFRFWTGVVSARSTQRLKATARSTIAHGPHRLTRFVTRTPAPSVGGWSSDRPQAEMGRHEGVVLVKVELVLRGHHDRPRRRLVSAAEGR